jgi:hypothetical protein
MKLSSAVADNTHMKQFLKGLVLGASLMYWYLNYSTGFFVELQKWTGHSTDQYQEINSTKK